MDLLLPTNICLTLSSEHLRDSFLWTSWLFLPLNIFITPSSEHLRYSFFWTSASLLLLNIFAAPSEHLHYSFLWTSSKWSEYIFWCQSNCWHIFCTCVYSYFSYILCRHLSEPWWYISTVKLEKVPSWYFKLGQESLRRLAARSNSTTETPIIIHLKVVVPGFWGMMVSCGSALETSLGQQWQ